MRKFLLLLFLLLVQMPIWGQDVVSTREALADTITGRLFEYVEDGAEKMVDGEFSILRIPANVWNYFKSKEKRQAIFEQRLLLSLNKKLEPIIKVIPPARLNQLH